MVFPTVSGSNLLRQQITLPRDLSGELNLLLVPFQQWQQMEVDTWIETVEALEKEIPGFRYYELPTIQRMNFIAQTFINEGMRAGIPNSDTRGRTVTLYIDKRAFRTALNMPDENHIYLLLVRPDGSILWQDRGAYQPETAASLVESIRQAAVQ
jgi:hypothetical protein